MKVGTSVVRTVPGSLVVIVALVALGCSPSDESPTVELEERPSGPQMFDASELAGMTEAPSDLQLIHFSGQEWKRVVEGAEILKGDFPDDAIAFLEIPIPGYTPVGPDVVLRPCFSFDRNEVCVPRYELGVPGGLEFVECECFPVPEEEEEPRDVRIPVRSIRPECRAVLQGGGTLSCEGTCPDDRTCAMVMMLGNPRISGCVCLRRSF